MARIPRKTQKVFCGNSNAGEIAVFGTMKTGTPQYSTDIETLQSNEYEQGWSDAILNDKAPYLEEMNGVQYGLSSQIAYMLQQGLACEYDAGTTYYKGSTVAVINDTTVTYYKAVADNFSNINPVSDDGTHWVLDSISKIEDYNTALTTAINTLDTQVVKLTGNQTVAGNKTFTGVTKVNNSTTVGTALSLAARSGSYIKLGEGLILQWGIGTTNNHSATVSLSLQYTGNWRAFVCDAGSDTSTAEIKIRALASNGKSFTVYSSASASGNSFYWFTIGR